MRKIQTYINKIKHINDRQLADSFNKNRHYISDVYRSYSQVSIEKLLKRQNIRNRRLFKYIRNNNEMGLQNILKAYEQKAQRSYTPIHKLMIKHKKSVNDMAKLLHVSYQESYIHMHSWHITLRVLKRYSKVLDISFKDLANKYGYGNKIIKAYTKDPYYRLHSFLRDHRKLHHWSQTYVADQLNMKQNAISGLEHYVQPTLIDIVNFSKLFDISPSQLLRLCPKYRHISLSSPSYKLVNLAVTKKTSFMSMAHLAHISSSTIKYFLVKKTRETDKLPLLTINKLCFAFNLHPSYFGPAEDRITEGFVRYAKYSGMKPCSFGYRYNKLRCKQHLTYQSVGKILNVSTERAASYSKLINPSKYIFHKILSLFPTKYDYLAGAIYRKVKN